MIDILYIVYPTMTGLMNRLSNSKGKHPFYENVLSRASCRPKWPSDLNEWNIDDWLSELKGRGNRLYFSIPITGVGTGAGPRWCNDLQWQECLSELISRSKKVVLVDQNRENFIYDRINIIGSDDSNVSEFASWWKSLNSMADSIALIDKKIMRIEADSLSNKKGNQALNKYLGANLLQQSGASRSDQGIHKVVKKATSEMDSIVVTQKSVKPCDVLTILESVMVSWEKYRGVSIQKTLANAGISHDWTGNAPFSTLKGHIESSGCKIVINEIWACPAATIRKLATTFPAVKFINLNHSAPSFVPPIPAPIQLAGRMEVLEEYDFLAAAYPNIYNGTVMSKDRFELNDSKVVELANPCMYKDFGPGRKFDHKILSLSLICRFCPLKNLAAQFSAVRKVAKIRPTSLLLATSFNKGVGRFVRDLQTAGVNVTLIEWGGWEDLMNMLNLYSDIGLQASLSESLNMVALEHMMLGKPVVGCEAIEFLPSSWKANPQDPQALADVILDHAENLEERGELAVNIASRVIKRNSDQFVNSIQNLLL